MLVLKVKQGQLWNEIGVRVCNGLSLFACYFTEKTTHIHVISILFEG